MDKKRCRQMWRYVPLLVLLLCAVAVHGREVQLLNRGWMYTQGDARGAERVDYDDSTWQPVGLPHSFSIPYFLSKDFYTGYGWYRRTLQLDKRQLKGCVALEFDGVFQEAEVYVNGRLAGHHTGGYTGFCIDLTPHVHRGSNVVAVRVNNLWRPDVAPRGGEHVFSGGIYRNVRLVCKSRHHLAWCGTAVTTPTLARHEGARSNVRVASEVVNATTQAATLTLLAEVQDAQGHTVLTATGTQRVEAGDTARLQAVTAELEQPLLWSTSHPHLYTVVAKVLHDGRVQDSERISFGFRWMEWTADRGFFLNGQHHYFRGANVHQDQAGWGDAVTDSAMVRDVRMMKEAGFDMIRGSHYPHAPAFVEACDRLGVLFWSEAPFWGTGGPKVDGSWTAGAYPGKAAHEEAFERSALAQLAEMIRIHRNHPSVMVWSMSNEPFFTEGHTLPGVRRLLQRMVDLTHRLDPTRRAAVGGVQRPLGKDRIDLIGDVAGYNGDGANIEDFQMPGIPSVVTEYGSTTADRPGKYTPGWGDLNRDEGWRGRTWRSGQAIWCGFDHGSIFGAQLGKMGIVDYFRLPKRSWYWYRNEYAGIAPPEWPAEGVPAALQLTATKESGIATDGTDDVHLTVAVADAQGHRLSNALPVSLRIVSGPGEFPTGKQIDFAPDSDIRMADGLAAITLRSYYAGTTVVEATAQGLPATRFTLHFVGGPRYKAGKSREAAVRRYVRFEADGRGAEQTYGRDNPTFASSAAAGQPAGMAADGDTRTWWQPEASDTAPALTLDTERGLRMRRIRLTLGAQGSHHYKVEVSADGQQWHTVADNLDGMRQAAIHEMTVHEERTMRYVRVSFAAGQGTPRIAEIAVTGQVAD